MRSNHLIADLRQPVITRVFVLGCALLLASSPPAQADDSGWLRTRLRLSITAAEASAWDGQIALSEGRLERLQALNTNATIAAGGRLSDGEVVLQHRQPLARDVIDFTAHGPPGAELTIRLGQAETRVAIDSLRQTGASRQPVGDRFETVLSRLVEDHLRVETARESLLFAPRETFEFDLLIDPMGVARGEPYDVTVTLSRGRDGPEVWRSEPKRHSTPAEGPARQTVRIPLPGDEGTYRVSVTAKRPPGFFSRFTRLPQKQAPPSLAERTFQLAVFDDTQPAAPPGNWRETYSFDPRSHHWHDRLPRWMKWTAVPGVARGPRSSDGLTDLLAEKDGAIEVPPRDGPQSHWRAYPLPVDEPGSSYAVEVETINSDTTGPMIVVLEPDAAGELRQISGSVLLPTRRWNRNEASPPRRLLFRPRTSSPLLLVVNPHEESPARFGAIRLFKSSGGRRSSEAPRRLVALDWSQTDLPTALGASLPAASAGVRAPDLQTWLETAELLADRVEAAGANSAVVTVNQRGGALYPSRVWPTPQFDRSAWRDGSTDLPRREGLRVIAREFARRGLRLAPAVRFDTPSLAEADPGREVRAVAVKELLDHLGPTSALLGVAVRVTPDGSELLSARGGPQAQDADALIASYAELDQVLRDRPEPTPLMLLPSGAAGARSTIDSLTPRLRTGLVSADEALTRLGLGPLAAAEGLVLVARPHPAAPVNSVLPPEQQAVRLQAIRRALPPSAVASLRAGRQEITLLDSQSRLGAQVTLFGTVATPSAEAALLTDARRDGTRLVLLDGFAADGLLDREAIARRLDFVARPPAPLKAIDENPQDVVVDSHEVGPDQSLVTLTNGSAWTRRAQLTIETPSRIAGARTDEPEAVDWYDAGRHALTVSLPPYSAVSWRFRGRGVRALGVRVDPAPEAQRELAERLADLQSRDTTRRRPVDLIANPSFEQQAPEGGVAEWTTEGDTQRTLADAIAGQAGIAMRSQPEAPASLTSSPFPGPATGQLVIGVGLRRQAIDPDARLRIELLSADGSYLRDTELTGEQLAKAKAFFPNDDLPISPDGRFRLRFTLSGEASMLIDDIRTEDLVLPLDAVDRVASVELRSERLALVRLMSTADSLLAEGRLEACRDLLDGYWSRFLIEHFPAHAPEEPAEVVAQEQASGDQATPEDETPSLGERIRGYLPGWWR